MLIYDHRCWGSSDGSPRNSVDPQQQAEDYHDAVLFAQSLPDIDPRRVCIWGIGHSGGAVLVAAGDDPNVKAVVAVMPFISGRIDAAAWPEGALERAWVERKERVGTSVAGKLDADVKAARSYLQVWDESAEQAKGPRGEILLHGPTPYDFIAGAKELSEKAETPWANKLSVESLYRIAKVEPRDYVHKIAPRRLLYLAATVDPLSGPFEEQKKCFSMAGDEGKEFVKLEGEHIEHYFGTKFERNVAIQLEWLRVNL